MSSSDCFKELIPNPPSNHLCGDPMKITAASMNCNQLLFSQKPIPYIVPPLTQQLSVGVTLSPEDLCTHTGLIRFLTVSYYFNPPTFRESFSP